MRAQAEALEAEADLLIDSEGHHDVRDEEAHANLEEEHDGGEWGEGAAEAATRIQAVRRGYVARREVAAMNLSMERDSLNGSMELRTRMEEDSLDLG